MVETLFSVTIRDFLSYSSNSVSESPLTYHSELLIEGNLASGSKWIASKVVTVTNPSSCTWENVHIGTPLKQQLLQLRGAHYATRGVTVQPLLSVVCRFAP